MTTPTSHRSSRFRTDSRPPSTGPTEKEVLRGFLDYLRQSVSDKLADAPEPGVRTPGVPSGTNLLGLVRHLTHVERAVFLDERVGRWAATFRARDGDTVASVLAGYRDATSRANDVLDSYHDLSAPVPRSSGGPAPSMRWAMVHMIEETGRHAGHLDILRELLDGRTGR